MGNLLVYYYLEGREVKITTDMLEWAKHFEKDNRTIGKTEDGDYWISTVFIGIDHSFLSSVRPVLFETMIFHKDTDYSSLDMDRYCTYEEAEAGHEWMVERVSIRKGRLHIRLAARIAAATAGIVVVLSLITLMINI